MEGGAKIANTLAIVAHFLELKFPQDENPKWCIQKNPLLKHENFYKKKSLICIDRKGFITLWHRFSLWLNRWNNGWG